MNQNSNAESGISENENNTVSDSMTTDTDHVNKKEENDENFEECHTNLGNVKLTNDLEKGEKSDESDDESSDEDKSSSGDEFESADEAEIVMEDEQMKIEEEKLTEEEKLLKKEEAQKLKEEGNKVFKEKLYKDAVKYYSRAIHNCPYSYFKERSIMYSNRAACKLHMEKYEDAVMDCSKAIELHPHYLKAILRRAELYEKLEKLEEALADYQRVLELDPIQHGARQACMRLPDQIKEKNEKLKEEMMGKLKDLGNMVLKPFGLSTNNFKFQQDPNTGGYSVNFQQNPES